MDGSHAGSPEFKCPSAPLRTRHENVGETSSHLSNGEENTHLGRVGLFLYFYFLMEGMYTFLKQNTVLPST